ncbi:MAG: PAS domain-containing sensor histidine kinase, partial [Sphingobacteriales bacterium]
YALPLLRFFENYTEEEIQNITRQGISEFLDAIISNNIDLYLASSRERWIANQLPHLIGKSDISGDDIILLSHIRKRSMVLFLPHYTADIAVIMKIQQDLDDFFVRHNVYFSEAFSAIFKDKVREEAEVKENEERLTMALETAEMGTWDCNPETGKIIASQRCREIFGLNPGSEFTLTLFKRHLHDGDEEKAAAFRNQILGDLHDNGSFETEFEFRGLDDGILRWVKVKGKALTDADGKPYRFLGTILDNTNRKKAEQLLQESESKFQLLADAMPQMIWVAMADGVISYFNRQWVDYTGVSLRQEEYKWGEVVHPDDVPLTKRLWEESLASGKQFETEYRLKGRDGNYRWFLTRALSVEEPGTGIARWFGTCTDIHEQKLAEESLLLQARVLESMEEGVSVSSEEGIIMFTNAAEDSMFGYESGELIGKHVTMLNAYDESENKKIVDSVIDELKQKGHWTGEWHNRRKDGSDFYTYSHITALNSGGKYLLICVQRDITQEKQAQSALIESEERFRALADNAPMFIWVGDAEANLVYYNNAIKEYVADNQDEFLKNGWANITHPEDIGAIYEIYSRAMSDPQPFAVECRLKGGYAGAYRWFLFKGVPRYQKDRFVGYIGTALDIEDQKKFTQELESRVEKRTQDLIEINHKLERSNEELEQFAYVASHDLQEPLRKISAFGNILASKYKTELGESGEDLINRMQSASERMRTLIEELLTYSRVSRQSEQKPIVLPGLLKEVMVDMETTIRERNAVIKWDELGRIMGNPMQIRQLLQNLLSNSLKFSKAEEIPVINITSRQVDGKSSGLTVISADEDKEFLLIEFKDNGIGFEQQYAEKIFQVFQRLHGRSEYPGSGVGLSIVQKVIENHKGYIIAEGRPGEGACFRILLPLYNGD